MAMASCAAVAIDAAVEMYVRRLSSRALSSSGNVAVDVEGTQRLTVRVPCLTPLPKLARRMSEDDGDTGKGMTPFLDCDTPASVAFMTPLAKIVRSTSEDDDVLLFESRDVAYCTPHACDNSWDFPICWAECDNANGEAADRPCVDDRGESKNSPTKQFQVRIAGTVRESLSCIADKGEALSSAVENLSHQMEDSFNTKASAFKEKASSTLEKGRASAEEKTTRRSRQLEEIFDAKVALLEEKARCTLGEADVAWFSALDSSVMKCSRQFEDGVNQRASAFADKSKAVVKRIRSRSEESRALTYSRQLPGIVKQKSAEMVGKTKAAAVKLRSKSLEKTRSTYSALDSSATRRSQQLEGLVQKRTVAVADKTKTAATLVRNRSEELASTALTKSGELASSTRGKLKAAGQDGLRALAKSIPFHHGGG